MASVSADGLFLTDIIIWNFCRWRPGPTLATSVCAHLLCLTLSSSDCVSGLSTLSTTMQKKKKQLCKTYLGFSSQKSSWSLMLDPATVLATVHVHVWRWDGGHSRSRSIASTRGRLCVNVCVSKWVEVATRRSNSHIQISFHSVEGEKA